MPMIQRTLSGEDRLELARLEAAHQRKTSLAVSIIRVLNDLGSEAENSAKLARVTELLSSAAHTDRERVLDAEAVAKTIIETQASGKSNELESHCGSPSSRSCNTSLKSRTISELNTG